MGSIDRDFETEIIQKTVALVLVWMANIDVTFSKYEDNGVEEISNFVIDNFEKDVIQDGMYLRIRK